MNFSEARQGEDYKVDRLVLKAMADEAEGQISGSKAAGRCKRVEDKAFHFRQRENLDTERAAFTITSLWDGTIERDTIAKLRENFWSNGYLITSSGRGASLSSKVIWPRNPQADRYGFEKQTRLLR